MDGLDSYLKLKKDDFFLYIERRINQITYLIINKFIV